MGSFENYFERHGIDPGWSREYSLVMVEDNAIARGEAIDNCIDVARQNFAGFGEGRAKEVLGQRVAANKTVKTVAGVIGMELDNPVEMGGAEFVLQNFDFRFDGGAPEFPVEIAPAAGASVVIFETGWIANGIDLKQKAFRHFGSLRQIEEEFCGGERAGRFVAMNGGEDADANRVVAIGSAESETGKGIFFTADFKGGELVELDFPCAEQRAEECANRTTPIFEHKMLSEAVVHSVLANIGRRAREKKLKGQGAPYFCEPAFS